MLKENLKDSAEILHNVLHQPLEISGTAENISLLQAVQNYSSQQPNHSDLSKVLHTFSTHREPLEVLIQELHLIACDLTVS
jgi:hypothetical protein